MKKMAMAAIGIMMVLAMCSGFAWAGFEGTSNTGYGTTTGVNTKGTSNSYFGLSAGAFNDTGTLNTFIGTHSGQLNTSGHYNTFVGAEAGAGTIGNNITGGSNTFMGSSAGASIIGGGSNVFLGYSTGTNNEYGSNNTFIGTMAGLDSTGSNNVFIGFKAGSSETTGGNKLFIDNCHLNTGADAYSCIYPLIYGEFDNRVVKINGQVIMTAVASPSDARYKKNIEPLKSSLEKVMNLNGVSYEWKVEENPGSGFKKDKQIGLIAQDVETIIPKLVFTDRKGYKSLSYEKLVPVLVEAIKEQQKTIAEKSQIADEQKKKLDSLEETVANLIAEVNKLKSRDMSAQK